MTVRRVPESAPLTREGDSLEADSITAVLIDFFLLRACEGLGLRFAMGCNQGLTRRIPAWSLWKVERKRAPSIGSDGKHASTNDPLYIE